MPLLLIICFCLPCRGEERVLEEAPLKSLRGRAQRCYDAGDIDGGHQGMAELLAAIPGRVELAAELLGVMGTISMVDRRTDRWTEYAAERLVALHQAGFLEDDHAGLFAAYDNLAVIRWNQGRTPEAWEAMQQLLDIHGDDPLVRLGAGRMLAQVESPAAIPLYESVLKQMDGTREDDRARELLGRIIRSLGQLGIREIAPLLSPWSANVGNRNRSPESIQSLVSQAEASLARYRDALAPRKNAVGIKALRQKADRKKWAREKGAQQDGGDILVDPDALNQEWSELIAQMPNTNPSFFDQCIRTAGSAHTLVLTSDRRGLVDPWQAIDLHLQEMDEATMAALRQIQEAQYKEQVRLLAPELRQGLRLLGLYRASPWSATANTDLLALAQAELNRGHTASALRSFLDIMNHSIEPATRRAAQVGIWLAAASEGTASGLDTLFEGVDPAARFPWMGKSETAANIKQRLQKGMPADVRESGKLADLELRTLRLPAAPAWPAGTLSLQHGAGLTDLQVRGDRILAGARNWLAWYDASAPTTPLWSVVDSKPSSSRNPGASVPGYWRPPQVNGRLYTRAGESSAPSQVRALDIESGRTVWATEAPGPKPPPRGAPIEFHNVISDPVVGGGCVYYVEQAGTQRKPGGNTLDVVCVEADDGSPIWRSTLVRADDETAPGRQFREVSSAVSIWGNALTLSNGSLYLGNAGTAARLDARNGRVAWVRAYRGGLALQQIKSGVVAPLGAAPLVAGDRVLLVPRECGALLAVDGRNGGLLWEQPFVLPVELLGAWKDSVVVRTMSELIGVALGTGEVRWHVPVPAEIVGRCALRGDVIHLASPDALLSFNAEDGTIRERRAWPADTAVWNYAIAGKALVAVTDETAPTADYRPGVLLAGEAPAEPKALRLPFTNAWFLPRERAHVFAAPTNSPLQGRLFVAADGMLEAIEVGPQGRSAWRRFTPGSVGRILFDQTTLVLCSGADPGRASVQATMAIDGRSGKTLWRLPVFQNAADVMLTNGVFLIHDNATEARAYELATGKPLWSREGFFSPTSPRLELMAFAQEGQLHLFGEQSKSGILHLRMDLRTGAMLPRKRAVEGSDVLLGKRSLMGMGKQAALIHVVDRSGGGNGKGRVYRYALADGKTREIEGMDRIFMVSPPYVLVGEDRGAVRALLSGDDAAYKYSLDRQGDPIFSDGLMMFSNNNKISVVDPALRKRIVELDVGKKQLGNPGIIKLDGARILLYGANGDLLELKEIDVRSGSVVREASLRRFDGAGREQLRGRPSVVNNVLIFSGDQGLQALVGGAE